MPPAEPPNGVNFFLPWPMVEWAIGILGAAASATIVWVWNLGRRIDEADSRMDKIDIRIEKGEARNVQLQEDIIRIVGKFERLETTIYELKDYVGRELRELPSRKFIESQITQLSERMDGMIDAKLVRRASSHES